MAYAHEEVYAKAGKWKQGDWYANLMVCKRSVANCFHLGTTKQGATVHQIDIRQSLEEEGDRLYAGSG